MSRRPITRFERGNRSSDARRNVRSNVRSGDRSDERRRLPHFRSRPVVSPSGAGAGPVPPPVVGGVSSWPPARRRTSARTSSSGRASRRSLAATIWAAAAGSAAPGGRISPPVTVGRPSRPGIRRTTSNARRPDSCSAVTGANSRARPRTSSAPGDSSAIEAMLVRIVWPRRSPSPPSDWVARASARPNLRPSTEMFSSALVPKRCASSTTRTCWRRLSRGDALAADGVDVVAADRASPRTGWRCRRRHPTGRRAGCRRGP